MEPEHCASQGFCQAYWCGGGQKSPSLSYSSLASASYHHESLPADALGQYDHLKVEELNGLTAEQRERIYEELHGIADVVEETPELVSECLEKMRYHINTRISTNNKKAWDRALFLRPGLEKDDKMHLMFLRAERFDPAKAAAKMCRHFEHKLELFGDCKLVKRITLDDLGYKEKSHFYSGASCHFLINRDKSGRGIYFMTIGAIDCFVDWKVQTRYAWYMIMSALEDNEEVQRRGVVQIGNLMGSWRHSPAEALAFATAAKHIITDWPFRSCGFHLCYDDVLLGSLMKSLAFLMGTEYRIRERTHFGSSLEAQYSLLTFGIRIDEDFSRGQGLMSREYIDSFLRRRQQVEDEWKRQEQNLRDANPDVCEYPSEVDVLMGRGQGRSWAGNQLFLSLSQEYAASYHNDVQPRFDKTMMAIEIVQRIQLSGGRFLERTDDGWVTVPDQVAKEKANQAMRMEGRKRNKGIEKATPMSIDK